MIGPFIGVLAYPPEMRLRERMVHVSALRKATAIAKGFQKRDGDVARGVHRSGPVSEYLELGG